MAPTIEHALFNHVAGAVESLLARLKHETNTTAQVVLLGAEELGGADQHRHM
jgi:hypothetical protein